MSRRVIISKIAEKKLEELFQYLIQQRSVKVKSDFVKKLDNSIAIIKRQPEAFPKSHQEIGLHKCVVTKQTTLYYRFDSESIKIVTIFDNRQSPEKFKKEL